MLGINIMLFKSTLYKALGEYIGVLPWTGHFDGSAFVKKCPGALLVTMRSVKSMVRGSLYDFEVGGKDVS